MALRNAIAVFYISLLGLPLSYLLNTVAFYGKDQGLILLTGVLCLLLVALLPQIVLRKSKAQRVDSFINVMSLLTYNSITSLVMALENDGLIAEFLGYYLRDGVPYMKTAFGTMISYWDGIAHNAVYMVMLAALTWNQSFYDVGLYWVGSFGHRLLVLVVAVAIGSDGLGWVFLMQVPYIVIFLWAGLKFTKEKTEEENLLGEELAKGDEKSKICLTVWKRPVDLLLVIFYFSAGCFTFFRFICAMGGNCDVAKSYIQTVEPYLKDPSPFSKAEILVQAFYFIPYYGLSIFALLVPGKSWAPQWSLIYAGSIAQGQVAYIGSSFHYRTPYIYRVPQTVLARSLFWFFNGILLAVPHYAAYLYNSSPAYFLVKPVVEKIDQSQTTNGKPPNESIINRKNE